MTAVFDGDWRRWRGGELGDGGEGGGEFLSWRNASVFLVRVCDKRGDSSFEACSVVENGLGFEALAAAD